MQYDEKLGLIRLEWLASSERQALRTSAAQLVVLLRELAVRYLLLDINSLPDLPVADQLWLGDHWLPSFVALPLERVVLVIDGSRVHNQLAIDMLYKLGQPALHFDAQYFADAESALDWLTDGSLRLLALAAEWATRPRGGLGSERS